MTTGASEQKRTLKSSREAQEEAFKQAEGLQGIQEGSEAFQMLQAIAQLIGTGEVVGPGLLEDLDNQAYIQAGDAFRQQVAEGRSQLAGATGLRSGSSNALTRDASARFAGAIGDAARANRIQAAQINRTGQESAFGLNQTLLQTLLQPRRDHIQSLLGGGQGLAQTAAARQPTNFGSILGTVLGTAAGALLGGPAGAAAGAAAGSAAGGTP